MNRALTVDEHRLVEWLLRHGNPEALAFLPQLDRAKVTSWQCPCGCKSINFAIDGHEASAGGMNILADFYYFGDGDDLSGIFVWETSGILAGLEVYGLPGGAAKYLPAPDELRESP